MYFIRLFCVILIFLSFISCSKKIQDAPIINQNNLELQTIEAYREGLKELERGDALGAHSD